MNHEVGEEVMLDTNAAEPSYTPVCSPLPPRMLEDPMKDVRGFDVKIPDLDPAAGGIGFTDGCKGCADDAKHLRTKVECVRTQTSKVKQDHWSAFSASRSGRPRKIHTC